MYMELCYNACNVLVLITNMHIYRAYSFKHGAHMSAWDGGSTDAELTC